MGLFQKAVETYDNMEKLAGAESERWNYVLAPVGFNTTTAKIVITITENGDFVRANKQDENIMFPITQESAGRSRNAKTVPHPLCDKLMYMCPDNTESYNAYLDGLQDWCDSDFVCPKIKAILGYVKKGSIRADIEPFVKDTDEKKDFVCWRVKSTDCSEPEEVWKSKSVADSYTRYYQNKIKENPEKNLCYVSGNFTIPAKQHLKGVVPSYGTAKLISANDKNNFTYRGRFADDSEALTVGFISSQKAHNALKWIISNDGFSCGNRTFVCWNPKGKKTENPLASLFSKSSDTDETPTPDNYRKVLADVILRCKNELDLTDETVIAVFDAASKGRLSVCYYSEMKAYDFLERLRFWDETAAWLDRNSAVRSPDLKSIADAAYGVLRTGKNGQTVETDKKVLSAAMERLLLCRLERSPFPADIMRSAVQKCSSLRLYDDGKDDNREKQLFTTCAIIKKYRYDRFREEWIMALEPEKKNRSYQFGRLLAVMEKAERDTFEPNEKREPNAMRLQELFVKRPLYAAKIIIEQLKNAYYPRLTPWKRKNYDKLIGEIMQVISECPDGERDKPLGEEYLMGYYLQKTALHPTNKNNDNNETEDEEE